ncbi:MAG: hypothetical protein IKF82_00350 [Bacilli bacterium]|nr:hypothetical protein [Bacilli bacterium]
MFAINLYSTVKDFFKMVGVQEKQDAEGMLPSEMYNDAYLERLENICECMYPPIECDLEYDNEDELYEKVQDVHYLIDQRIRNKFEELCKE